MNFFFNLILNAIIGLSITWLALFGINYANEISHNPQIVGTWELVLMGGVPPGEHEDEAYSIFEGTVDTFFADGTGASFSPGADPEITAFNWWTRGDSLSIFFADFNIRYNMRFRVDEAALILTGTGEEVWMRVE